MFVGIPKNNGWAIEDVHARVQSLGRHENVAYNFWKLLRMLVILVAPKECDVVVR